MTGAGVSVGGCGQRGRLKTRFRFGFRQQQQLGKHRAAGQRTFHFLFTELSRNINGVWRNEWVVETVNNSIQQP